MAVSSVSRRDRLDGARNRPGEARKVKQLRLSAEILFRVLTEHEPDHPMLVQAIQEATHTFLDMPSALAFLQAVQALRWELVPVPGGESILVWPVRQQDQRRPHAGRPRGRDSSACGMRLRARRRRFQPRKSPEITKAGCLRLLTSLLFRGHVLSPRCPQASKHTTTRDQLIGRAVLNDLALVHDQHQIGTTNGAQAMRDNEGGAAFQQREQRGLRALLGQGIHSAGGFIENQERRDSPRRASEANHLPLPQRQARAMLADLGIKAVRDRRDQVEAIELAQRLDHFFSCRSGLGNLDVVQHRGLEQEVLLRNNAETGMNRVAVQMPNVVTIKPHDSLCGQMELRNQTGQGGLAAAGVTDKRDTGAGLDLERDVAQG